MFVSPIAEIISDFKKGHFVILVDHPDRENEGDLMLAAEYINSDNLNFLLKEARGLICLTLTSEQVKKLQLPLMKSAEHHSPENHAAFTYSFEAKNGITTGISARERAHSMLTAIQNHAKASDIVTPGHVFALVANDGGVLTRAGHTEASVDLAKLSGLNPAGVICELLDDKGDAANKDYLIQFSKKFNIKIGSVDDLIQYQKTLQSAL